MMELWFGEENTTCDFSIRQHLAAVDAEIKRMKPPDFISKPPRSIKKHLGHWKGSLPDFSFFFSKKKFGKRKLIIGAEHRAWILYYSLILLKGKLTEDRYRHWCYFVIAISILLSPSISPQHLGIATLCLTLFYFEFEDLYGNDQNKNKNNKIIK